MYKILGALLLLFMCSCQTAGPLERDALLLNPTAEVQKELEVAIGKMLNSGSILLNAEDLTKSSVLPVERRRLNDANGQPMQGFQLEEPSYFKLVRQHETCYLILLKSNKREAIASAQCRDR